MKLSDYKEQKTVGKRKYLRYSKLNGSANARAVAREVIDTVARGEKVIMKKILKRNGYSDTTAIVPANVMKTAAYQDEMFTYAQKLEKHRQDVLKAMMGKDLNDEQYRTLADAQTKLTHDVQLLTGGNTENLQMADDRNTLLAIIADIRGASPVLPTPAASRPAPEQLPPDANQSTAS